MSGIFGVVSKNDCSLDLFYGVDYHSHLGTRRGGLAFFEDSGIISRMSYVFDDFLSVFGLNGKAVYTMLLGLGCNTMSTYATRNLSGQSLKLKTALINPYLSCMARLPIFVLIASTFFGVKAYWVVAGLYVLGFIVALLVSLILNKTIDLLPIL